MPPLSVTVAVIVCVPEVSVLTVIAPPVPREPSRLDVQAIALVRFPSSWSLAAALNVTVWPGVKTAPSAGAVIATVGASLTTILIRALPLFPPLSATEAVMVCAPEWSVLTVIDPPVPSGPSRLDDHVIAAVRFPSSRSFAVAVNVTAWPGVKTDRSAGALMVTVGGALTTIVIVRLALLPPLSVTVAVMVCVPECSVLVIDAPVPSALSMLDVHTIVLLMLPSSRSLAVPVNVTTSAGAKTAPSSGALIATAGAALTTTVI
jgi:hypothetical protein